MENKVFEMKNLEKWKSTLDACIRCGYCFEHCPVSKFTGWESDTPRAKLIMLFGILAGKLEPSKHIAEKIASCFHCQRCVAACSSGVPLTDIFKDAKADFAGTEYESTGTTSVTGPLCARCLVCIGTCPHEARYWDGAHISVDMVKCQGCGICLTVCPAQTTHLGQDYGTDVESLKSEITAFLDKEQNKEAKAIVFGCNWSNFPGLQSSVSPAGTDVDPEYKILINMCGGRLGKPLLLEPFIRDAWGILVACCPEGDCEHNGNVKAHIHVKELKELFKTIGIDPERIQIAEVKHADKAGFQKAVNQFMEKIKALGPIAD